MIPCKRKCWDCGNVAMHDDNITPHVLCKKCGSQDTRLVKGTQAMSEAPAVYYPKQTEPDGSTITIGKYVHWDIFDAYRKAVDEGAKLLDDLRDLMQQSTGVAGLHLNGDLAEWDTLTAGGRCEEWLLAIEVFSEAMQAARRAGESVR